MAIPLTDYKKIKDTYCIAYLGDNQDIIDKLSYYKTKFESMYPGINIYICTKHNLHELHNKNQFAYIREIREIEDLLE